MIQEWTSEHHEQKQPIHDLLTRYGLTDHAIIQAVVQGYNRGKIFVDDLVHPRTMLIWAYNEMFYLVGDADNQSFPQFLPHLIRETIAPWAKQIGEQSFQLEVYPRHNWHSCIESLLQEFSPKRYYRWSFLFHPEQYPIGIQRHIPEGYELQRIDERLIQVDSAKQIAEEILKFWPSLESFLKHGLGYCVMYQGLVITTCISAFACKGHFEIGINTYEQAHRGKGLATLSARAFIEDCLQDNITPHWSTESFRLDSIAIAEKLGFERRDFYRCYYFHFS